MTRLRLGLAACVVLTALAPVARADEADGGYARVWIGVAGALDLVDLPAADGVCKLLASARPANGAGYDCTNPDGSDYPSRATSAQNDALPDSGAGAGRVDGSLRPGDVRVMALFDYAVSPSLLLGARAGFVLDAYPGQAAVKDGRALGPKLHVEARATYLFGDRPLAHVGFAPMAFAALGVSEVDGHETTTVSPIHVAGQLPVVAWIAKGPLLAAIGGGLRYELSQRAAFSLAARVNAGIGGGVLLTYGPEIGLQYGF